MTIAIPYPFPLRPDFVAELVLPDDLTPEESQRVAIFLASIATEIDHQIHLDGVRERWATAEEIDAGIPTTTWTP